jgi:hypothetical protein
MRRSDAFAGPPAGPYNLPSLLRRLPANRIRSGPAGRVAVVFPYHRHHAHR